MVDWHGEIGKVIRSGTCGLPQGGGPFGEFHHEFHHGGAAAGAGFGEAERGSLKYDILGILWDGRGTGYDIMLTIEEQRGFRPSPGSIYPALQMLKRATSSRAKRSTASASIRSRQGQRTAGETSRDVRCRTDERRDEATSRSSSAACKR